MYIIKINFKKILICSFQLLKYEILSNLKFRKKDIDTWPFTYEIFVASEIYWLNLLLKFVTNLIRQSTNSHFISEM